MTCIRKRTQADLHSGFNEVQSEGQGLPHEHIGVVGALEGLLQLLELPAAVVGAGATLLHWPLFVWGREKKKMVQKQMNEVANGRQGANGSRLAN